MNHRLLLYFLILISLSISCKNKPNKMGDAKNKPNIIQENINTLESISHADSLVYFAKQKDEQLQLSLSDSLLADFREKLGVVFYKRSNYNVAEDYFQKSEKSYRKANLPLQANQMLANRAVINDVTGDYIEAIAIYVKVADYFKQQNDSTSWASALGNIGVVYEEIGMGDKAIYYDKLSLAINLEMHDTLRAATKYNNIGVTFSELKKNPDSAVYYYSKAYKIYKTKGHVLNTAQVGNNLGMQYIILKNYTLAKNYIQRAECIFDSIGNLQGKADAQQYYGELYRLQGNKLKAVEYFKKAMVIFKKLGSKKSLMETGTLLSKVYTSMGNYPEATQMMQFANTLKDSLMNVENKTIIADMESKYQLNEKNSTIEILRLKEALTQKQIKNQLAFIVLLIVVFILLVLTYYFSFQRNKLKEKELRLELQNYILRIDELKLLVNKKGEGDLSTEKKLKQFDLSGREIEVLRFIAQGYRNSEIAEKLFVSQNTIKSHIKKIYLKLDVRNRVEALKRADIS
jgi:DNA-binding CsgD family transcriptional regulator